MSVSQADQVAIMGTLTAQTVVAAYGLGHAAGVEEGKAAEASSRPGIPASMVYDRAAILHERNEAARVAVEAERKRIASELLKVLAPYRLGDLKDVLNVVGDTPVGP